MDKEKNSTAARNGKRCCFYFAEENISMRMCRSLIFMVSANTDPCMRGSSKIVTASTTVSTATGLKFFCVATGILAGKKNRVSLRCETGSFNEFSVIFEIHIDLCIITKGNR